MGDYIIEISMSIIAVFIAIRGVASYYFGKIAKEKGFDFSTYLLLSIFLGLIGYLMVVALPDRKGNKQ